MIEILLACIQIEKLQKPIIFFLMLIGLLFFSLFGVGCLLVVAEQFMEHGAQTWLPSMAFVGFSLMFFGLAYVCFKFMKKCLVRNAT